MTPTTRRRFIQAMGLGAGASLVAPLLQSVAAEGPPARRVVIFLEGNGTEPRSLYTPGVAEALTGSRELSFGGRRTYPEDSPLEMRDPTLSQARALRSLAGGRGRASLEEKAALVFGLSSKESGGGHTSRFGALSCVKPQARQPQRETVDHFLGQLDAVRGATPFDVVRLGNGNGRLNYSSCATGWRSPTPITTDPTLAFYSLFGSVAEGAGQTAFRRRGDLLDYGRRDIERTLRAFSGSSRERAKLEAYLASLEGMVERRGILDSMSDRLEAAKPAEPSEPGTLYTATAPMERLSAQIDLGTAALLGGLTNVLVVSLGSGNDWGMMYPTLEHLYPSGLVSGHNLRHGAGGSPDTGYRYLLHELTACYVDEMTRMARTLDAAPEPDSDGTVLDHTLMLYMSDNGERHHSKAEEWPMLLLGGSKLGFKTDGRSVVYPRFGRPENRRVAHMMNTISAAAGQDTDGFFYQPSDPTQPLPEPLSELWAG